MLPFLPDYVEIRQRLEKVGRAIVQSRGDRRKNRKVIYAEIEKDDLAAILKLYQAIRLYEVKTKQEAN